MHKIIQHRSRIGLFHSRLKTHGGNFPQSYKGIADVMNKYDIGQWLIKELTLGKWL